MSGLSSRERLVRTFEGKEIDRIPTYDILHNIDFIEHVTGQKINPKNVEDLLCKAASNYLDLIRHYTVPDYEGNRIVEEEDGFVYRFEWWTGHLIQRPEFRSIEDVKRMVHWDIERIYDAIDKKKICKVANNHCNLFYEDFEYFEEIKEEYKRISNKLDGTIMLGPEGLQGVSVAYLRYDFKWWSYLYYDYPELLLEYFDALYDYELALIDSFADRDMCPFAMHSGSIGNNDRLLFPPEVYRDIIIPGDKKVIDRWKKYDTYVIAFLDGYKLPLLDDYVKMEIDAVDPFEPYAGMDVGDFRKKYPQTVICQPIDCTQLLPFGTEKEVISAVNRAIKDAGAYKILIGSTSEIHPGVNYRNALAMYDTARNYKF